MGGQMDRDDRDIRYAEVRGAIDLVHYAICEKAIQQNPEKTNNLELRVNDSLLISGQHGTAPNSI